MKISFLILNYKTPHHLRLCLRHIQELHLSMDYEIIVVDNASNDGSAEMVKALFPTVRLIVNSKNLGHPAGNNVGLRVAQGEYIMMINPDIIFQRSSDIEKILSYLDQHPQVALLGPKLHNPDGTAQYSCYRRYTLWTPIFRRTFLGKLSFGKRDIARHLMVDFDHQHTKEVEWLLGACLCIRKKAVEEIGLMREDFFLYFGDYEWCDRAHAKGWQVIYFHDTHGIFHFHKRESASARFSLLQMFSYVTRVHLKDWFAYLRISSSLL